MILHSALMPFFLKKGNPLKVLFYISTKAVSFPQHTPPFIPGMLLFIFFSLGGISFVSAFSIFCPMNVHLYSHLPRRI